MSLGILSWGIWHTYVYKREEIYEKGYIDGINYCLKKVQHKKDSIQTVNKIRK